MKKTLIRVAAFGGIAFALLLALTVVMEIVDPEGMKKAREENAAAAEARAEKREAADQKHESIHKHGFVTGYELAKRGAVKPTSAEVDALARKAALSLNDEGGAGFKAQWKDGFWLGWNKGD
jgi:acetylornithine/succinyldiaminopimelate/putrescine aminotransferase